VLGRDCAGSKRHLGSFCQNFPRAALSSGSEEITAADVACCAARRSSTMRGCWQGRAEPPSAIRAVGNDASQSNAAYRTCQRLRKICALCGNNLT
jgi:hypothetical protein